MKLMKSIGISALALALGACAAGQTVQSGQAKESVSRQHFVKMWGIPEPYTYMENPLPKRHETYEIGARVFADHCASCHGASGVGDGEGGRSLSPSPRNFLWLADVPEKQWDAYMYWSTAEGGDALGTAMPAYKDKLSKDEIWAVTEYIQENFPFVSQWKTH